MKEKNTFKPACFFGEILIGKLLISGLFALAFFLVFSVSLASYGIIIPPKQYVYGENLGWVNFNCDNCGVKITSTELTGYVWSREYGWINLSPSGSGVGNQCVGDLGRLSGKAWSKTLGWLDFSGGIIDGNGRFTGMTDGVGTKAGRLNFDCVNCEVVTNFKCKSPAQVLINLITDNIVPSVSANITITNEGLVDTEYQYEWCVVSDIDNSCGGGDDIFYSAAAKLIVSGESWTTDKIATVPNAGTYYFKLKVTFGDNFSVASQVFTAVAASGGGGGGGVGIIPSINKTYYDTADFNRDHVVDSVDFSILLYFWKKNFPFSNAYIDINKDKKVNSIEFSIMLSQWGRRTI